MSKEELRKEMVEKIRENITFAGQIGDYVIGQGLFDWFWSKLEEKDKEIETYKELQIQWQKDSMIFGEHSKKKEREYKELEAKLKAKEQILAAADEVITLFSSSHTVDFDFKNAKLNHYKSLKP